MRIVSGNNKGKKLYAPKDMSVRPTGDKIKEAIFNMIGYIDEDSTALDLFAGTGNVGIEFLSRGVKTCYFVDVSHKSLDFVRKNIELCKLNEVAQIIHSDYEKAIIMMVNKNLKFDYIFADPPYDLNCCANIVEKVLKSNILTPNGLLIIESDKSEKIFENIDENVIKYKEKIYGRTRVSMIKL